MKPNPDCEYCLGTGSRYWHSTTCVNDLCALNGDIHSCRGQMEPCPCTWERTRAEVRREESNVQKLHIASSDRPVSVYSAEADYLREGE